MSKKTKRQWLEEVYGPTEKRAETPRQIQDKRGRTPLYDHDDIQSMSYGQELGYPGEYPFTRGVYPSMYRGQLWTMRQYAGFGSPEETNQRFRFLLDQGQTGLSVAFDLPTQCGYDSDHPISAGQVGQVGVPIDSLLDMEILLDQVPLDAISTSMTINATAPILLALYLAVAQRRGFALNRLHGTIQNDILKEYVARGTYIYPPKPSLRLVTDVFQFCGEYVKSWNTISISGYHMREAGCTAAQEIAFTLGNAITYVQAAVDAGVDVDQLASRLSFFFAAQSDLFEEIAKFRAARRLWARIMKRRFAPQNPRSLMLRFHTQTAGVTLTAQEPMNNVVRTTLQALAAVLGGTQSLHTNSWDEALSLPSEDAAQLALRTQQIIAWESGVTDVIDPLGGSYYVESLTDSLETEAESYIQHIDALGGSVAAIEQGYMQKEIQQAAYRFQQEVEKGERTVVGVNRFTGAPRELQATFKVDSLSEVRQRERLHQLKNSRREAEVSGRLRMLERAALSDDNLMPVLMACVQSYCTLGEISDVLRNVFGEMKEVLVL